MLDSLYSLTNLAIIALGAFGTGRSTLRVLRIGCLSEPAFIVWGTALGFVICGWLLSLAGFAGALSPLYIGLLTSAGIVLGLAEAACVYLVLRNPLRVQVATSEDLIVSSRLPVPNARLKRCVHLLIAFIMVATLICALAPPVSKTAISESLDLPKTILLQGSIHSVDGTSAFHPQFASMLYAWAQMLDGPVTASLLSWLFGGLLVVASAMFARMFVGREWAWFAAALALGTPGVLYQMHAPLGDLMAATFITLALVAWWKCAVELEPSRWLILAGLFLGAALATKAALIAFPLAVAMAFLLRAAMVRESSTDLPIYAARTLLCASPIAAPWWIWSIANGGRLAPVELQANLLIEMGPLLLAAVPGVAVARKLRGLNVVLGVLSGFVATSWLIVPQARLFAAMVPLLATLATWSILELSQLPNIPRRLVKASFVICAGCSLVGIAYPLADAIPVACGWLSRDAYLRERLPAYAAAEVANCVMSEHDCLRSDDPCRAYFKCRVESAHGSAPSPEATAFACPGDSRVTHILLRSADGTNYLPPVTGNAIAPSNPNDRTASRPLPLTDYVTRTASGERIHYRLLLIR